MHVSADEKNRFILHDKNLMNFTIEPKVRAMKNRTEKDVESEINSAFSFYQADILPKWPIHEKVTLVEYQLNWIKIVDF